MHLFREPSKEALGRLCRRAPRTRHACGPSVRKCECAALCWLQRLMGVLRRRLFWVAEAQGPVCNAVDRPFLVLQ